MYDVCMSVLGVGLGEVDGWVLHAWIAECMHTYMYLLMDEWNDRLRRLLKKQKFAVMHCCVTMH